MCLTRRSVVFESFFSLHVFVFDFDESGSLVSFPALRLYPLTPSMIWLHNN